MAYSCLDSVWYLFMRGKRCLGWLTFDEWSFTTHQRLFMSSKRCLGWLTFDEWSFTTHQRLLCTWLRDPEPRSLPCLFMCLHACTHTHTIQLWLTMTTSLLVTHAAWESFEFSIKCIGTSCSVSPPLPSSLLCSPIICQIYSLMPLSKDVAKQLFGIDFISQFMCCKSVLE